MFQTKDLNNCGNFNNQLVSLFTKRFIMDDLFQNTPYKILKVFLENPNEEFSIRKLARLLKKSHVTLLPYLKDLQKLNLIITSKTTLYDTLKANTESYEYKYYKKNLALYEIKKSGLIEYIQKQTLPNSIILFGSFSKGTNNNESDIDLFVESQESKLNLTIFENYLNAKINVLFENNINDLPSNLKINIMNGTVLYGKMK
jgi:predicted nucleotidyltransferase